ncbi:MAG TPA: heavy metal translocating P-type ATPase metal-binding domain-containing protein, partial [Flavobacteriales bacterium]|nr:heavy metal translocating P-type ATPase metal-binding domain-containing protein [Flavobacteriales bacterium]
MKTVAPSITTCYHCGDPCEDQRRKHDGHEFCCQGCAAVYGLLNEAGLRDYYNYEERPGVKQARDPDEARAELFDLAEVRDRIVEFQEGGITRVCLHVPQMHCSSCI